MGALDVVTWSVYLSSKVVPTPLSVLRISPPLSPAKVAHPLRIRRPSPAHMSPLHSLLLKSLLLSTYYMSLHPSPAKVVPPLHAHPSPLSLSCKVASLIHAHPSPLSLSCAKVAPPLHIRRTSPLPSLTLSAKASPLLSELLAQ